MRSSRIKKQGSAVYHCISRTVAGEFLLEPEAKEVFRQMLWRVAEFSAVEVLAYVVMTNHFHVLVRVPERIEKPSRGELLRRYALLYPKDNGYDYPDVGVMRRILEGGDEAFAQEWEERLLARMNDVSAFMKTLKQRFSVWYNQTHDRFGTLWSERFKSVLVEDVPETLKTVAAYIDLNPVRAQLAEDPSEYRWCSYAEAMAGKARAERGLARVMGRGSWAEAREGYRMVLFGKSPVVRKVGDGEVPYERVKAVLAAGGKVELSELLRCKVRYFTEGAILGSRAFVREMGGRLVPPKASKRTRSGGQSGKRRNPRSQKAEKRLGELPCVLPSSEVAVVSWQELPNDPVSGSVSVTA